jgi:hypothetical protein
MTSLKWNSLPPVQYFVLVRVRRFDVIFCAVVKAASPTTRLTPVDENAYFLEAILPVAENLSL